jgi:uncharacterized glyoxalase superfamily protein PhnB
MISNNISPCIVTNKVQESKDFYVQYFDATVTFDCGWYVNLRFGRDTAELQFIAPQQPEQSVCKPDGLMYNFAVEDVDIEHRILTEAGLQTVMPIEDHPWGDRGFAIQDPNGIVLYIYSDREPSEEFKPYCKT